MLLALGCTDQDAARRTLDAHGFDKVEITGYEPWTCSDSDVTSTGFRAVNARGDDVNGVVCCGWLMKGCTVRF